MAGLLEGGLWERSFILPEHKRAMERQDHESKRKTRPVLDAQEMEQIQQVIAESLHEHRKITLRLFGEFEDNTICGIVNTIQTYRKELKLVIAPNEWQWISIRDILSAE